MLHGELPLSDVCDLHLKLVLSQRTSAASRFGPSMAGEGKKADGAEGEAGRWSRHSGLQLSPLGMALKGGPGSGPRGGQTLVSLAGPRAPLRVARTCAFVSQPQGNTSPRDTSSLMLVMRNCRCQTAKPEGCWEWVVGADTSPASSTWGLGHPLGAPGVSPTSPHRPQRNRWPQRVCAPLGWTATALEKVLSSWPAGVNVCLSSSPGHAALRLTRGFCALIPECVEGLRGPLGCRWGRGAGRPQLIPGRGGIRGLWLWPWVPWVPLG